MQWQRLTVFRDVPDLELLRSVLGDSCRLFKSKSANAYLLETVDKHNETRPMLGGYYDSPFNLEGPYDLETLETFEAENAEYKGEFQIDHHIVKEAIFVSRVFQTEVLSSYSNDEEDDYVAVAKNGILTHLRFNGFHKTIRTLSRDEAASIESEFPAVRMDPPGQEVEDQPVCEYEAYEGRMSPDHDLSWHPYWRYIEGELDGHVVFKSLSCDPPELEGNLMFRNAHIEFQNLFGRIIPDPYDEPDDFELLAEIVPPHLTTARRMLRMFAGLAVGSVSVFWKLCKFIVRKYWKYLLGLAVLVMIGIVQSKLPPSEEDLRKLKFSDHCKRADGKLEPRAGYSGLTGNSQCRVGGEVYLAHNLPGDMEEVRRIPGMLEKKNCDDGTNQTCLFFDEVRLDWPVKGADLEIGETKLTAIKRTQHCEYNDTDLCDDGRSVFEFEVGVMLDAPRREEGDSN